MKTTPRGNLERKDLILCRFFASFLKVRILATGLFASGTGYPNILPCTGDLTFPLIDHRKIFMKSSHSESFNFTSATMLRGNTHDQWPRKPLRMSNCIRLPCSWKNPPPPPHPTYHPTTKEIRVENFKMYNRIYNQQPQKHLSNKFYPYHHHIKCPLPLPRPSPPSRD